MLIAAMADIQPEGVARLTGELRVPILGKPFTVEWLPVGVAATQGRAVSREGVYGAAQQALPAAR